MGRTRDTSKVYVQSGLLTSTITSNYSASNNETIFVNTASSAITVTLPSSPSAGNKIKVLDVAANAQNNNITVLGNGYNIGGASAYIIDTPDSSVEALYINSSKGWNILNEYVSTVKPGAPTGVSATDIGTNRAYNDAAATVSFVASAEGDPATSFTVISTPGSITATGTSSPIVITGLQSNTNYTFVVRASNAGGISVPSSNSNSITATTVPQAPTITAANSRFERVSVDFTANGTGGKAISSYTITPSGGVTPQNGGSSPISIPSLTPGTSYTFTATATNDNGTSLSSSVSPSAIPYTASGGNITTTGGYRYHTFLSSSSFVLGGTSAPVDYAIIAGGGGGGSGIAGGGGAGGKQSGTVTLSPGSYSLTVGGGGGGGGNDGSGAGGNSSVFNGVTATGGGAGAGYNAGRAGGSAGSNGGSGSGAVSGGQGGGGGGSGGNASGVTGGAPTNFFGTNYAGGGGAGSNFGGGQGAGGGGGAGNGAPDGAAQSATANTGSGGGGGGNNRGAGGSGGSGIILIRYLA